MTLPILAALDYVRRGWPVLALLPQEKHPRRAKPRGYVPPDGSSFLNTQDPDVIQHWWAEHPGDDVGIETGGVAGFWVLDLDGEEGIDALRWLTNKYGDLPRTPTSRSGSGRGRHHLFQWPGYKVKSRSKWHGVPIDTKGDGGQFVAPPSSHKSGNRYEWIIHPDECPIAPAPRWLLEWLRPDPAPRSPMTLRPTTQDESKIIDRARRYVRRLPASIMRCNGSGAAMTVARALRWGYCFDESTAFDIFVNDFNGRCVPPWSAKEIRHKLDDGAKPDPYGRPYGYLRDSSRQLQGGRR